jgi:DNA-binding CsgD family transcriptional regulator
VAQTREAKANDLLSIVEAAYCLDGSVERWTTGLLDAADRAVGSQIGGFACLFRANTDDTLSIDRSSAAIVWQGPEMVQRIFDGLTQRRPGWLSAHLRNACGAGRCTLTSEVDPQAKLLPYRQEHKQRGVHDGVNLWCMDLDREGVLLSLGIPSRAGFTAEVRQSLARVATHIVAGLRLRKRLTSNIPVQSAEPAEAVLSPDGTIVDARGEAKVAAARRALRAAVLDVERARTSLRRQPGPALALWKGLVSARWTLVDEFDAHGAKYVVARENSPQATGLHSLTPAENCVVTYAARGFSTKEIAYTLGISATTVRVLLMRAARRCGVRSREELLQRCSEADKTPPPAQ